MKRDWDVIREVLVEVEGLDANERGGFAYDPGDEDDDKATRVRAEHAMLLWKAGFIEAIDVGLLSGPMIMSPDLTWQGHELLDTLRSKPVWERIKTTAKDKGLELTFDVVKALGQAALEYVLK